MNIVPFSNYLLVRRAERKTATKGGILMTEAITEKPSEGTVLAVGEETKYAKVGDRVLFNKYAGSLVEVNEEMLLLLSDEDVFGRRDG